MTAAHSIKIYLSVKIIDFLFACYDALCTGIASICISRKRRAHVMRGFDPIAWGIKRSDLTPMKLRECCGLLLNSSASISFLYSTRIPNTVIGIDRFGARTGADAWVFIWAVFGDEFGKSDRKNRGSKEPATVGAGYQDNFRGCAAVRFSESLRSAAQIS